MRQARGTALLRLLRGPVERPTWFLSRWVFLRLLGLIYLIAFASLWSQLDGLIGSGGILPAQEFLNAVRQHLGDASYWRVPTLCWLAADDRTLHILCGAGVALSLLLIVAVAPIAALVGLWALYLSLVGVGQDFLNFQWDALLLETGFLAIFIAPRQLWPRPSRESDPPAAVLWLMRWLLFRLMFLSGVTKLTYHDPTWWGLTALEVHYQTQPLPTWIGWYAHQLPAWLQQLSCAVMFAIEIGMPFLIFGPRRLRLVACAGFVALMLLIGLTGNYTFFNLLALALCVLLVDDSLWRRALPARFVARFPLARPPARAALWRRLAVAPLVIVVVGVSVLEGYQEIAGRRALPASVESALNWVRPFRSINGYGLFRVMTTTRPEIVIEGSDDGRTWHAYEFRWKPGDPQRAPAFVEPHQPRLDWQMWFAALQAPGRPPWFMSLVRRLLEGSRPVRGLLGGDAFVDAPPRYIRAVLYEYCFTDAAQRAAGDGWWRRELRGLYLPSVSLPRR